MRAVVVERPGGPEVLVATDRPDLEPGPGELVVALAAAGVNFKDVYEREGLTGAAGPFVPGCEGAGTVIAVGPDVRGPGVGDRVAWWAAPGSYAEQVVVRADATVPVPDDVSEADAAAVLLQGLTAHYLVTSTYPARKGETALVHSAAGGLGQHLTRLLAERGVRVIGTVSTPDKVPAAEAAGAAAVVVRDGTSDLAERVRGLTEGDGVDVVFDGVGRDTFEAGLRALRRRGTFVLVGAASGPVPALDPQALAAHGSLFLTRPTLVDHATDPAELRSRAADVFQWLREGRLQLTIGARYPLDQAARAHADLQSRRTTGKLLLLP
ncbi:quinone oxidoreductase family protein [Kitasatospora sp. NPDC127111]|uniref:quinone oxidoreductase family protein n=1 Tax=Kitasatospora sp. NPDC127111 TaxID=3345363 RepID=UPI00362EF00A